MGPDRRCLFNRWRGKKSNMGFCRRGGNKNPHSKHLRIPEQTREYLSCRGSIAASLPVILFRLHDRQECVHLVITWQEWERSAGPAPLPPSSFPPTSPSLPPPSGVNREQAMRAMFSATMDNDADPDPSTGCAFKHEGHKSCRWHRVLLKLACGKENHNACTGGFSHVAPS